MADAPASRAVPAAADFADGFAAVLRDAAALVRAQGLHNTGGPFGAIRTCAPHPADTHLARSIALRFGHDEDAWDDDRRMGRTHENDVIGWLARLTVDGAALTHVFGPQWPHVVALVRRAAELTAAEAAGLRAAYSQDVDAEVAVRNDAAAEGPTISGRWTELEPLCGRLGDPTNYDACQETAGNTARNAAWWTDRHAAWAARSAAWALAGRHRVPDDHYRLLTGTWAAVVGPVHPDDPAPQQHTKTRRALGLLRREPEGPPPDPSDASR